MDVGIYTRLSQDRNGEATSTKRQEQDCRRLAEAKGWQVADVYTDRGISGYSGAERAEFERLVADLEAGKIAGAVAWKLDRFGRNRADHNRLMIAAEERGVVLATVVDGIDTSTQAGSLALDMLASLAREESRNTSTRVRRAFEERARAGRPHTAGGRCFGFTADWKQVPREVAALRRTADALLAGDSLAAAARSLNDREILTARGNRWSGANLRRTITSPYVAGLRAHHDALYPGTWTPVLPRETWERLRIALERRAREHRGGGWKVSYLLTGVARCHCGGPMNGEPKGDGTRRYRCVKSLGGCGRVGILAGPLEEWVYEAVAAVLDGPGLARALERRSADQPDVGAIVAQLDAAEERLEQIAEDYGEGVMSRPEWLAARDAAGRQIEGLRSKLTDDSEAGVLADLAGVDLAGWWGSASVDRRRALLRVVIEAVEVGPWRRGGRGWDPERVTLRWRV